MNRDWEGTIAEVTRLTEKVVEWSAHCMCEEPEYPALELLHQTLIGLSQAACAAASALEESVTGGNACDLISEIKKVKQDE